MPPRCPPGPYLRGDAHPQQRHAAPAPQHARVQSQPRAGHSGLRCLTSSFPAFKVRAKYNARTLDGNARGLFLREKRAAQDGQRSQGPLKVPPTTQPHRDRAEPLASAPSPPQHPRKNDASSAQARAECAAHDGEKRWGCRERRWLPLTTPSQGEGSHGSAPRAVRRRADPETAAPRRKHTQARDAPFTSRANRLKSTRGALVRIGQFSHQGWHPPRHTPRSLPRAPRAHAPTATCPPLPGASASRPSAAARKPLEPVHAPQPLAGSAPAPPRAV